MYFPVNKWNILHILGIAFSLKIQNDVFFSNDEISKDILEMIRSGFKELIHDPRSVVIDKNKEEDIGDVYFVKLCEDSYDIKRGSDEKDTRGVFQKVYSYLEDERLIIENYEKNINFISEKVASMVENPNSFLYFTLVPPKESFLLNNKGHIGEISNYFKKGVDGKLKVGYYPYTLNYYVKKMVYNKPDLQYVIFENHDLVCMCRIGEEFFWKLNRKIEEIIMREINDTIEFHGGVHRPFESLRPDLKDNLFMLILFQKMVEMKREDLLENFKDFLLNILKFLLRKRKFKDSFKEILESVPDDLKVNLFVIYSGMKKDVSHFDDSLSKGMDVYYENLYLLFSEIAKKQTLGFTEEDAKAVYEVLHVLNEDKEKVLEIFLSENLHRSFFNMLIGYQRIEDLQTPLLEKILERSRDYWRRWVVALCNSLTEEVSSCEDLISFEGEKIRVRDKTSYSERLSFFESLFISKENLDNVLSLQVVNKLEGFFKKTESLETSGTQDTPEIHISAPIK